MSWGFVPQCDRSCEIVRSRDDVVWLDADRFRSARIPSVRFDRSNALRKAMLGRKDDGLSGPIDVRVVCCEPRQTEYDRVFAERGNVKGDCFLMTRDAKLNRSGVVRDGARCDWSPINDLDFDRSSFANSRNVRAFQEVDVYEAIRSS